MTISDVVFGVQSTSNSTGQVTLSGGTATFADINLSDTIDSAFLTHGAALYNSTTGAVTSGGQDYSIMLGSDSANTITSLSYYNGGSNGGGDGYTVFVGLVQGTEVPEPSTALMFLGISVVLFGSRRFIQTFKV